MNAAIAILVALLAAQDKPDVESLLRQLDSENLETREAASKSLINLGFAIRPRIEAATRSGPPERVARLKLILDAIDRQPDSLPYFLKDLIKGESFHQIVRQSAHRVRMTCTGKEWPGVERMLKDNGFKFVHSLERAVEGKPFATFRFERDAAEVKCGGIPFRLQLNFEAEVLVSPRARTRYVVRSTETCWDGAVEQPFQKLAKERPFPKGSVLDAMLDLPNLTKAAADFPRLTFVSVRYEYVKWGMFERGDQHGWHFCLYPVFGSANGPDYWSETLWIPSTLDPDSPADELDPFASKDSKDTLGSWRNFGEYSRGPEKKSFFKLRRLDVESKPAPKPKPESPRYPAYSAPDVAAVPADLQELVIRIPNLDEKDLAPLASHQAMTGVSIAAKSLSPACLDRLASLPKLTQLRLELETPLNNDALEKLGRLKLTELRLESELSDRTLERLTACRALKVLTLSSVAGEITDEGTSFLARFKELEELNIWMRADVTKEGLAALSGLPKLRRLSLVGWDTLDDTAMSAIGALTDLESLSLLWMKKVSDEGLREVERLKKLNHLEVTYCEKVTEKGMEDLRARLPGKFEHVR